MSVYFSWVVMRWVKKREVIMLMLLFLKDEDEMLEYFRFIYDIKDLLIFWSVFGFKVGF